MKDAEPGDFGSRDFRFEKEDSEWLAARRVASLGRVAQSREGPPQGAGAVRPVRTRDLTPEKWTG